MMILKNVLLVTVAAGGACNAAAINKRSLSYDDNTWAKYVRAPKTTTLKPRSILAANTTGNVTNPDGLLGGNVSPTILTRKEGDAQIPTVIVDFGQNVVGLVSMAFAGSSNSSSSSSQGFPGLKLAFSETQEHLTDVCDFTRSDNMPSSQRVTNGTDQIAVANQPNTWTDQTGCQYDGNKVCSDGLHGFRYLKIWLDAVDSDAPYTQPYGSVSISSIELEWSAYLGTPDTFTGWFECSDEDLTQWWFDGVYTADMVNDVFLANETEPRGAASPTLLDKQVLFDGAKRDRDPYVGDLAVVSLTTYLSHDTPDSTRNVLADLADHQRSDGWIPPASINNYTLPLYDYPMWWVVCTNNLVMYTGETSFATQYYTAMKNTLDNYYGSTLNSTGGILDKTNGYGDYAFLPRSGPITYYNTLYVHALKAAAQIADTLGQNTDAETWRSRADEVSQKLFARNWDTSVGAFFDGGPCPNQPSSTICNTHAQDGNGLAVLSGAVNSSTATSLLNYYAKAAAQPYGNAFYDNDALSSGFSQRVYAFISYFELAGRFATSGAAQSAFEEVKRVYGWMAAHDPQITHWEGIGPNGSPYEQGYTSMAHGWSTGIVPLMSNYVLGITPTAPGFKTWQICPVTQGGNLTWARGAVGTPDGPIKVSWKQSPGKTFEMQIETPQDSSGYVCVPTGGFSNGRVLLDGKQVNGTSEANIVGPVATTGDGFEVIQAGGGSHTISVGGAGK